MAMKSGAVSPKSYMLAKWRSGLIERQISEGGKGCLNDQQRMEVNKTEDQREKGKREEGSKR